jgi:hypothetical protein
MNYRVFHTHSSCVHDWEFDFSGVLSINKQGYGLIPKPRRSSCMCAQPTVSCTAIACSRPS